MAYMLKLIDISKKYQERTLFKHLSLDVQNNDLFCITGKSGSGKTTLLNIFSLIEKPSSGNVIFDNISNPFKYVQKIRREYIGYIFQNYGLINNFTVKQNLDITTKFCNLTKLERNYQYEKSLNKVGLDSIYLKKKIFSLSGGEQQRIAIARLLITKPKYIFADEPTGNLDKNNRDLVFCELLKLHKEGATILYVTHDEELVSKSTKLFDMDSLSKRG